MKKLSFEKWASKIYDVPFIKPNFDLLQSMGVDINIVSWSQNTSDGKTKYVRVFHYGGWYEILENGNHYLLLGDHDWLGKDKETISRIKKALFDWASEELPNFGE